MVITKELVTKDPFKILVVDFLSHFLKAHNQTVGETLLGIINCLTDYGLFSRHCSKGAVKLLFSYVFCSLICDL